MTLPTFFIIGAAKAGTTSLHFYLDLHPQIQMSDPKEPHFFAGPENGVPFPPERVASAAAYERLFDPAYEVRGEASPSYTNSPRRQGVPERIKAAVPEAKFLYLVRDPVERTVSHYRHSVAAGKERRPLAEAIAEMEADPRSYLACHSLYGRQLELYLREFPQERIRVLDQAELRKDRGALLRQVFGFLAVDDSFRSARFEEELWRTEGRRVSPPGQASFIRRTLAPRARWLPPRARSLTRRGYERVFWAEPEAPELGEGERERLREFFAADVERLRSLTGEPLSSWSL